MTTILPAHLPDIKAPMPVSPASSTTMAPGHERRASPGRPVKEEEQERGRRRQRSEEQDAQEQDDGEDGKAGSSNSDGGPARKRRRSRKGLDKKFECPQEGCGKSYSRAEHL
ncbi:hypothetical protein HYQ45_005912 [Verticillium longisporum]|nr:hypothetical protein HYQ45_005912 [Verticillium longisporum]